MVANDEHEPAAACYLLSTYFQTGRYWKLCRAANRILWLEQVIGDLKTPPHGMGSMQNFSGRTVFMGTFYASPNAPQEFGRSNGSFNLAIVDRLVGDDFKQPRIRFVREKRWNTIDISTDDDWRFTVTYRRPWLRQLLRTIEYERTIDYSPADIFEWLYFLVFHDRPHWLLDDRTPPVKYI